MPTDTTSRETEAGPEETTPSAELVAAVRRTRDAYEHRHQAQRPESMTAHDDAPATLRSPR